MRAYLVLTILYRKIKHQCILFPNIVVDDDDDDDGGGGDDDDGGGDDDDDDDDSITLSLHQYKFLYQDPTR